MSKSVKHKKIKKFASIPLIAGMIFMLVISYGLFLLVVIHPPAREQIFGNVLYAIVFTIFTIGCSTIAFIGTARRWFTLLVIDEKGITTSLFHFFYRRVFKWDEITEILYYERLIPFLFVSQNVSLAEMYYDEIIKRKDVLQISLTPKIYKAITSFTERPIAGLTEDKIKILKLDK